MSALQIAWLELITVGGLGILLIVAGIIITMVIRKQNKLCVQQTEGTVVQYGFPGDGRMYPIVEYLVDGTCYRAKKKFRGTKQIKRSGFPKNVQTNVYEDKQGWLHIKTGPVSNLRQHAEQLWPLNSTMKFFYNPNNPKTCYIDRPLSGSFASILFISAGLFLLFLGVFVFFLMQL